MRFTSALVAGSLAIAASAQEPSATVSIDPAQQSVIDCIDECDATDIGCLARCNPVPNPNDDQVEAAHDCISDCDQGDGTLEQTEAYARCQAACVKEHYYDSTAGTPEPTGGNGGNGGNDDAETTADAGPTSAAGTVTTGTATVTETTAAPTGSESPAESGSATESESGGASGTETGAESTETSEGGDGDNGASGIFASTAAIFGAVAAFFAL